MNSTNIPTHISTTLKKVPAFLKLFFSQKLSVFLISIPGLGKTAVIAQFAQSIGAELVTLVASARDRLDIGGLPFVHHSADGKIVTQFAPMELIASLSIEHNPDGKPTVLYLNEAPHAPESLQPVLYRLVNERAVEGMHLRENVHIVADGNPSSSIGATKEMQFPLRRRFMWLSIQANVKDWTEWANANNLDGRVISFLNTPIFTHHFCNFDPSQRGVLTYATPASWHNLCKVLPTLLADFDESTDRMAAYCAAVGMAAGNDFHAYMENMNSIPDVDAVLKSPSKAKLPEKANLLSLLVGGVINRVSEDKTLVDAAIELAAVMITNKNGAGFPEFGVFMIRSLAKRSQEIRAALPKSKHVSTVIAAMQSKDELFNGVLAA